MATTVDKQLKLQGVFQDKETVRRMEVEEVDVAYVRATAAICAELKALPLWMCARLLWLLIKDCRAALKEATTP